MKIFNFKFQIKLLEKYFWASVHLKGEGSVYTAAIVSIIIIGSSFLVGGLYPDLNRATTDGSKIYEPEDTRADKNDTGVVQLRQLRAKKGKANKNQNKNNNQNNNKDSNKEDQSTPPVCENNGAIALLVDVSESMGDANKMTKLKEALLRSFLPKLSSSTIIGLYTFSSPNFDEPKERIPFGQYGQNKGELAKAIEALQPLKPHGATYMRDGFSFVQQKLAIASDEFKGKQFSLIVVSDGVPELIERDLSHGPCPDPERCYDPTQDPTVTTLPRGNIADAIKSTGVRIYSIAIYNARDEEITGGKLRQIMQNVASPDSYYDMLDSSRENELLSILQQIEGSVCK